MQVLQLVCKACGKPCRSETEKQLHMTRNPGHCEFVDKTAGAGPVDYTLQKEGAVPSTSVDPLAGLAFTA